MSHSAVFHVSLTLLIGAIALPATPSDDQDLEWATLIKCSNFLYEFKKSIADYRACLRSETSNSTFDQFWARVPAAVETCKAIEPLISSIKMEEGIDKDDRGPLWYIPPTDNGPFTLVTTGSRGGGGGRDEAAERKMRKTLPHIQVHHGPGVSMITARVDRYNFSSVGKFHKVRPSSARCFDFESQSPGVPLEHPASDVPPVDLVWSDGNVLSIPDWPDVNWSGLQREYLLFDGKQIDAANICQISIRSPWFERNATNDEYWIPDLPLPSTRICFVSLSFVLLASTDPSFIPIRSGFYSTADNDTYFNVFYVNVENPKCVAKYLANRAEVGRCEPQSIEKGRVEKGQFEVESEVSMIEG